jgi:endonuclease YncB( thermonuclease family)
LPLTARRLLAGTLTLCLAACSAGRDAARSPFTGRVVGIGDGDSITVLKDGRTQINVRLDGIDSPELGQAFGRQSKRFTGDLLVGHTVDVEPKTLDQYGRTVARVRLDGRDASVEIVRAGFAWQYLKYSSDPVLAAAEASARAGRRGLWAQDRPVPPWEFRAGRPRR